MRFRRHSIPALLIWRAVLISVLGSFALLACTSLRFVDIVSENQSGRVDYVILHYTSVDFAESLRLLTQRTERRVSSHYLVPENGDLSYPHRQLKVYQLVEEDQRAWHAGRSDWRGHTDLNSRSIGIEVVNRAECSADDPSLVMDDPQAACEFPSYDAEQIQLLIDLILGILQRHPDIDPANILAHSDIAIDRKLDPGPLFPWRQLYDRGIGAWYDEDRVHHFRARFAEQPLDLHLLQRALAAYGYDIVETGELDKRTRYVVRAFQMHFRPSNWSGQPDTDTAAILFALLEKYRAQSLKQLLNASSAQFPSHQVRLTHSANLTN